MTSTPSSRATTERTQSWRVTATDTRILTLGSQAARIPPGGNACLAACANNDATVPSFVPPGTDAPFERLLDCIRPALEDHPGSATALTSTVLVEGRRGAGRRTLVRTAAAVAGLHCVEVRTAPPTPIN